MIFKVTPEQEDKINKWLMEEVYPEIIAKQRKLKWPEPMDWIEACWDAGYPYAGSVGGDVIYKFTPNSIGCFLEVEAYGRMLDVSDCNEW